MNHRFTASIVLALSALLALSSFSAALSWCESTGSSEQIDVSFRATTTSAKTFEPYEECSFDSVSNAFSCTDYCVDESTLAKFHCSLHQPGAERIAKRELVDCAQRGFAGCSNGACVSRMPAAVPSPAASPSPKPKAWCGVAGVLSSSAPRSIVGADANGSAYAFTDYCSDAKTLARFECSGAYYSSRLEKCASGSECVGGVCSAPVVKPRDASGDSQAWLFYGVAGVLVVALGAGFWFFESGKTKKGGGSVKKAGATRQGARRESSEDDDFGETGD